MIIRRDGEVNVDEEEDEERDEYGPFYHEVDLACSLCGRPAIGECCEECGLPLCAMCFETGCGFCDKCPTADYRPDY